MKTTRIRAAIAGTLISALLAAGCTSPDDASVEGAKVVGEADQFFASLTTFAPSTEASSGDVQPAAKRAEIRGPAIAARILVVFMGIPK